MQVLRWEFNGGEMKPSRPSLVGKTVRQDALLVFLPRTTDSTHTGPKCTYTLVGAINVSRIKRNLPWKHSATPRTN